MIKLTARILGLEAEKPVVLLNKEDAEDIDVRPLDRVELVLGRRKGTAIVNTAAHFVKPGEAGLYGEIADHMRAINGDVIQVFPASPPESLIHIREKLAGKRLNEKEIRMIVEDTVHRKLSDIEMTAFVTALYKDGVTSAEVVALSKAMALTGKSLNLGKKEIYDKHSIGGVPGDKTSMLLVPIVGAAGLTIPKTSSRAITSPAGTADRFECLAPVDLELEEIKRIVNKINCCLVWGGAVDLAPADDLFIQIEYPLSIDPLLLPSVMSMKKAVGAKYLVIDIPTGDEAKVKTTKEAETLAERFIDLGKKLGIKTVGASTFGEQPIGRAIGPALEAREALEILMTGKGPEDTIDKVTHIAGILMDFKMKKGGKREALRIINSGKAYDKLKQLIDEQGGNPHAKPDDLNIGPESVRIKSSIRGTVSWIDNHSIVEISRAAGTPKDKGAGMLLHKKMGDRVRKGDTLFEIFANKKYKLERALKIANSIHVMGVGKKMDMLLEKIPRKVEHPKYFILER
ncbi:MAG: AMP phosphorylase [Candidatus Aenigmatarchaeota archaeon]|nr:MAG: AMP phosphorylase [Candidatus Aenigmarchaeota archaeon]